jgi:hypothetical protein
VIVQFFPLFSQEGIPVIDTNTVSRDTIPFDTISPGLKLISPHAIDKQVIYSSRGAKKNDLINKTATMIDGANVKYGDIEITADSIVFNMAKNTVFAAGRRDTTVHTGTLVFGNPGDERSLSIILNPKAIVYNIVNKQDERLLRSR